VSQDKEGYEIVIRGFSQCQKCWEYVPDKDMGEHRECKQCNAEDLLMHEEDEDDSHHPIWDDREDFAMTDINARIAKAKGWKQYIHNDENGINETWYTPNNKHSIYGRIPQYTTDWRLAGELVIESKGELRYSTAIKQWRYAIPTDGGVGVIAKQADTPQMAIALAWLEWRNNE